MNIQTLQNWNKVKLSELGSVDRGRSRHRPRNDASLYGGTYPFVQTGDVKSANFYITSYSQTYNDKGLAQSKIWDPGTLCITIAANIGESAILKIPACFPDSIVGFKSYEGISDVRFVKYLLDFLKKNFQLISKGTTQDNLSLEKILSIEFQVPIFDEQNKIANILSVYDNLIENNTRRIEILEQIAQAIYTEWFVNFHFPNHEKVKMVDSGTDLGKIPAAWKVKNLLDIIEVKYGKNLPTKFLNSAEEYNVYGAAKIIGKYKEFNREKQTVIVGCRGSVGQFTLAKPHSFITNNSFYLNFKEEEKFFYYYQLKNRGVNDCISGSAQPQITINSISSVKLFVPDEGIINAFQEQIKPIHENILVLESLSDNLCQARDLLLPKLVTGEIKI